MPSNPTLMTTHDIVVCGLDLPRMRIVLLKLKLMRSDNIATGVKDQEA